MWGNLVWAVKISKSGRTQFSALHRSQADWSKIKHAMLLYIESRIISCGMLSDTAIWWFQRPMPLIILVVLFSALRMTSLPQMHLNIRKPASTMLGSRFWKTCMPVPPNWTKLVFCCVYIFFSNSDLRKLHESSKKLWENRWAVRLIGGLGQIRKEALEVANCGQFIVGMHQAP